VQRQKRGAAAAASRGAAASPALVAVAAAASLEAEIKEEQLEGCAVRLHITVPAQMCKQAYKKIMGELRKGASVDGYRKGKVGGREGGRVTVLCVLVAGNCCWL
jgi:hypothetical protein